MGHVRHKYSRAYFLHEDASGKPTNYGAEGIEQFRTGGIRQIDADILHRLRLKKKVILDLGFGRGEAIKYVIIHGAKRVVGVDFSSDAFSIAQYFLSTYKNKVELYCEDALGFLKKQSTQKNKLQYDIVIMLDFIEHIPRVELVEILKYLHLVLSPQGILAINTPVYPIDNDVISNGLDLQAKDSSDNLIETAGMHCNRYTKESLRIFMSKCGFTGISYHYFVKSSSINPSLGMTYWSRILAFLKNHPVKLRPILKSELIEFATPDFANQQQTTGQVRSSRLQSKLRLIYDETRVAFSWLQHPRAGQDLVTWTPEKKSKPELVGIIGGPLKGRQLILDLNVNVNWPIEMVEGKCDTFTYQWLAANIDISSKTIWDIGAQIGYHTLAFSELVGPKGHVTAFEPNPFNVERIKQNLKCNLDLAERISLIEYALSDKNGESNFVYSSEIDDGRSSGSYLESIRTPAPSSVYESFSRIVVKTVRADTLVENNQVLIPDIIKLDVEGAEYLVLLGSTTLISEYKPIWVIEIHNVETMFYVHQFLNEHGYDLEILDKANISNSRCFIAAKPKEHRNLETEK
jgi:FkbM family methyltransferase